MEQSLAEKVTQELKAIHDPARDKEEGMDKQMDQLAKNPFPAQREIIKAVVKSFKIREQGCIYDGRNGGWKRTLMSIAVASMLKENPRVLVICPPHLVRKWIQEIKEAMPWPNPINLNGESASGAPGFGEPIETHISRVLRHWKGEGKTHLSVEARSPKEKGRKLLPKMRTTPPGAGWNTTTRIRKPTPRESSKRNTVVKTRYHMAMVKRP